MIVGTVGGINATPAVVTGIAGVGSIAAELTPRLLISVDPRGRPARGLPPSVVGDVEVGLDDAVTLVEPDPHMPDMPAVSSAPDEVDMVEPCVGPDIAEFDDGSTDIAVLPAPAELQIAIPPPS